MKQVNFVTICFTFLFILSTSKTNKKISKKTKISFAYIATIHSIHSSYSAKGFHFFTYLKTKL